jgi:hypothetical protein
VRVDDDGDLQVYDDHDVEPEQTGDIHYIVRVSWLWPAPHISALIITAVFPSQAIVASVQEHESDETHLVSFVRVPTDCKSTIDDDDGGKREKWLLFNDFLVKEVGIDEALSCASTWKVGSEGCSG